MIRTNKFFGSILLIAGTAMGAGMLAIPVTTGFAGFVPSLFSLFFCWLLMLASAFLFLEVNLSMKGEVNMISMAQKTLGSWGKTVTWIVYLLLLYSLNVAYISGSADFFKDMFAVVTGLVLPGWATPLPLLVLFGVFIYLGSRPADYLNRLLIAGLVITYIILVFFLPSEVNINLLKYMNSKVVLLGIPVIITSFGFHIIIPTITTYLRHNPKKLKLAVLIGSSIPFIIYIIWDFLLLGTVPLTGEYSIATAFAKGGSGTEQLIHILQKPWLGKAANAFTFFAIVTSFIGVSLSLSDFLTDGLRIKRTSSGRFIACLLTFVPPLIFVYVFKRGFLLALEYGAIFVAILLCLLPALMAWKLPKSNPYHKIWGKILIIIVIILSIGIIGITLFNKLS